MAADTSDDRRQQRLRELRQAQLALRKRLVLMVLTLVVLIGFLFAIPKLARPRRVAAPPPEPTQAEVALPPLDLQVLAEVRDSTPEERVVLEPEPFAYLLRMSLALLPDHLRMLDEPALPFDAIEHEAAELRGRPFRLRGELLEQRTMTRLPGAPTEHWYRLRDDGGRDFFHVSMRPLAQEFQEPYFRADGYFFKVYTGSVESGGERVTAPLLVGRELVPSYRRVEPVHEPDFTLLADVRDAQFGDPTELDQAGLWHLLNVAVALRSDPQRLARAFEGAPELNRTLLETQMLESPALFRGRPMLLPGSVVGDSVRYEVGLENPLRLDAITHAYWGNLSLGKQPVHLIGPGRFPMAAQPGESGQRRFYGWFLQLESAIDKEGNARLYPVYVVADARQIPLESPAFLHTAVIVFFGVAALLALFMIVLVVRDKRRSATFEVERTQRRHKRDAAQPRT
ncbi:MAG: hypothetical protein EYC70_00625 [Planctomycetota bacterium]|nr:MAG: hypothetical protein EYC70_00625 [Planctomycetota bacterium]